MSQPVPSGPPSSAAAIVFSLLLLAGTVGALLLTAPEPSVPAAKSAPEAKGPAPRLLRFGRIPNVSPREAYRVYGGLIELLDQALDCCDVELVLATDYASCVRMLAEGQIDLAWLGTTTYVEHRESVAMRPLVRPIWSGRAGYAGVLFTVEGSGIQRIDELRGKRIAFVDRQSASGYIYPANLLVEAGFDLDRDFAEVAFLGSHDAVLMAVLLGEFDAGAVFDRAYLTVADRARRMRLRILAQTEPIPGEPIVAGPNLEPEVADAVRDAFLNIPTDRLAEGKLRDLFGFEPATDEQYNGVRLLGKR